jgi:transcriptional regulator with XRE-family HTH domain
MRDAYLSAQTRTYVAYQIRTIRAQRGWSQEQLADKLHTSQSAVSRMEDRQYGKQNLHTLLELAAAFDCGLIVRFVRYADFVKDTSNLSPDNLRVAEFGPDSLMPLVEESIDHQSVIIYTSNSVPDQLSAPPLDSSAHPHSRKVRKRASRLARDKI